MCGLKKSNTQMKKILFPILTVLLIFQQAVFAQTPVMLDKVLVYYETNGFEHRSIDEGIAMITDLGKDNGLWSTDASENSNVFTTQNLSQYKAVIWCNTSGNGLLNASERAAFEAYIANGGGFVGIHAATDTYRDGSWPFYNELVGAIIRTDPNHTSNNFNAVMTVNDTSHPTVAFLNSNTWEKKEEYYYWQGNGGAFYANLNNVVLTVEETGNQPYDEARAMSWYKEYMGGRSFYTALGHNEGDYTNDPNFINHIEEAIKWAGSFTDIPPPPTEPQLIENGQHVIKNPALNEVMASSMQSGNNTAMEVTSGDTSQNWEFLHLGDNVYNIKNAASDRYLEVPNAECNNGANVATWTSANSNHQKFKIVEEGGVYYLRPQHCLQTAADRSRGAAGANVQLWAYSTTNNNQKWEILPAGGTLSTVNFNKETSNIAIFPNPVNTFFSVAGLSQKTTVYLVDLSGKVVLKKEVNPVDGIVDVSSLSKGVYFLQSPSRAFKAQRVIKM